MYITAGFVPVWGTLNINYERLIKKTNKGFFRSYMAKISGGYWFVWVSSGYHLITGLTTLTGSKSSHLETHIGFCTLFDNRLYNDSAFDSQITGEPYPKKSSFFYYLPSASIGYRFQKPNSPLLFRTGISIPESIYISIGFSI
jgi:membrane-bound acyltransferase YfiQ involved in biofilm formation